MCVHIYIYIYTHVYIIHTLYIHTYIHTYVRTYIHKVCLLLRETVSAREGNLERISTSDISLECKSFNEILIN